MRPEATLVAREGSVLEIERLDPPRWDRGEEELFWGRIVLRRAAHGDFEKATISSIVGWIEHYRDEFVAFFEELAGAAATGAAQERMLLRTEHDDLIMDCRLVGDGAVEAHVRVLDWWDPYEKRSGPYDRRRELEDDLTFDAPDLARFSREVRQVVVRRSRG